MLEYDGYMISTLDSISHEEIELLMALDGITTVVAEEPTAEIA
jgi:hypothetical protein